MANGDTILGSGANDGGAGGSVDGQGGEGGEDLNKGGAGKEGGGSNGKDGVDGSKSDDGGANGGDDDGKSQGAPESYETFTFPEGVEPNQSLLDAVIPLFKEANLSQEAAQKIIDAYTETNVASSAKAKEAADEEFKGMISGWETELKNDKDFGGDKYNENCAIALKAVKQFGTPEMREMLTNTGVGSHPEFVKFAHKIGSLISEDKFNFTPPGGDGTQKDPAKILYGEDGTGRKKE